MKSKKQKIPQEVLTKEFHQRMDEISKSPDGSTRSDARTMIAILEDEKDWLGDHAKKLGLIFDLAEQAISRSEFDSEFLSDIVLLAVQFGFESKGTDSEMVKRVMSEMGSRGGKAAQQENLSIKNDAFAWLDTNRSKFKSMDETAEAMVKAKLANISFRTYRDWVGEWKKLRSSACL